MKLRFVWHIFQKDARRLRWMIALTLALLARLAHFDSWREVATPNIEEGWLNILLPLAWSFLIALAVLEDPAVGEAPFWATVPCRWPSLLVAKGAFMAAFIHIPYFIVCVFIMQARGFSAADYLAVLFGKQLTLLALTLPAMALATLVGSVTQFMIVAIALTAAIGAPAFPSALAEPPDAHRLREIVTLAIAVIAALPIVVVQYHRNRTWEARKAAAATILMIAVIWCLPRGPFDRLHAMLAPASAAVGEVSIRLLGPADPRVPLQGFDVAGRGIGAVSVVIPVAVSGFAPGYSGHFRQSEVHLQTPAGQSYSAFGSLHVYPLDVPVSQQLAIAPEIFSQIGNSPVDVVGIATAIYYRRPEPVWIAVDKSVVMDGLGKCSAAVIGDDPGDQSLRIGCESPNRMPVVRLRLLDPATNREWKQTLGDSSMLLDYPASTWLSPVERRVTYIPLIDNEHMTESLLSWQVPRDVVPSLKIAITPEIPAGEGIVHYRLPNIDLRQYRIKQR
jgi:hypothetical protein